MENPLAIANYFVKKALSADDNTKFITNMKVVKLVYIAHGWYLALFHKPLISERAEAWKYGPVIPSVYEAFRSYGKKPIDELAVKFSFAGNKEYKLEDPKLEPFLDQIWETYKGYSGTQLSALTHQKGTPWHKTWFREGGKDAMGVVIWDEVIESHYLSKIRENEKSDARPAEGTTA